MHAAEAHPPPAPADPALLTRGTPYQARGGGCIRNIYAIILIIKESREKSPIAGEKG
jgi:hypothetical protein